MWLAPLAFNARPDALCLPPGRCVHELPRLQRWRGGRRCMHGQPRQCSAAADASANASSGNSEKEQMGAGTNGDSGRGSAGGSASLRSQEWARLILMLPLELSAIGAKTEAHWLQRRNKSSWWRSNQFPRARARDPPPLLSPPLQWPHSTLAVLGAEQARAWCPWLSALHAG